MIDAAGGTAGGAKLDEVAVAGAFYLSLIEHRTPSSPPATFLADRSDPHNGGVETPDFFDIDAPGPGTRPPQDYPRPEPAEGLWAAGERVTGVAGLVLALSSFMGWYSGSGVGVKLSVIGWNSGVLGKLVFFVGLAVLALVCPARARLRAAAVGAREPVVLALGALGTIFVLIRLISIPDAVLPADGRGIGIWIAFVAALGVIGGGLLREPKRLAPQAGHARAPPKDRNAAVIRRGVRHRNDGANLAARRYLTPVRASARGGAAGRAASRVDQLLRVERLADEAARAALPASSAECRRPDR